MNNNQRLRFFINEYWTRIGIDNLYTRFKSDVFKIKKGSEIAEDKKESLIAQFKYGLRELDDWMISIEVAKSNILEKLNNNF